MSSFLFTIALGATVTGAACPAGLAPLTPELSGWISPTGLQSAAAAPATEAPTLQLGRSATLMLRPESEMKFAVSPGRAIDPSSFAGLAAFHVSAQGHYRVVVDSPAWIDVVGDGAALASVGHGHGPDCSGISKMVDFALAPGDYLLQLSGSLPAQVRVMVTAAPTAD